MPSEEKDKPAGDVDAEQPFSMRLDPAATDESTVNARDGARKLCDPNEPSAVVGLGASAGGVAVLQQFFSDIPAESGMAFVVVMHLSPDFESQLASVLQHKTAMSVVQVNEAVKVRPNHVYVIPPSKQLSFVDSTLEVTDPQQALGRRVTIDLFFRTLAHSYGQRAVGVILSGTDQDGVIGLKHIRAQGGVTIAQDPTEAEYNSMPTAAIGTGTVDWVLPVAEMAPKLMEFVRNEIRMKLPPEIPEANETEAKASNAPGGETVSEETRDIRDESALEEVLTHLREQTGQDFTCYKRATVLRRVARRLQVNTLESIPDYLEFIRASPDEPAALLQDLLIGVTHFFRDRAAFGALEESIPQLFAGKKATDQLRIWVPGCASGEEAYSIAMLLCEHADKLNASPSFQIFATDIDEQSIHQARQATYPLTIEADVSTERLRRFFVKEDRHYRVKKDLRDTVLFASQNLLGDAPFTRLDLISCRNLLIYLNGTAQEQVFDVFHFALRPGGLLFLGTAEVGQVVQSLFSPVDAKHRLFVRQSVPRPLWKMPMLPPRLHTSPINTTQRKSTLPMMSRAAVDEAATVTHEANISSQERRSILFGELHLKLLEDYGPPSVLVNEAHNIVHLSERAGRYLTFMPGEPSTNLLNVVHPLLRMELRTALFRASQSGENVILAAQEIPVDGGTEVIDLHVRPISPGDSAHGFFLVLFERLNKALSPAAIISRNQEVGREMDGELQFLKERLHGTVEQYEASSEELKASNEELQAMNEELRSAAEELETSQEELQSVNEELATVNAELKEKVDELALTNSDLQNLMMATDVGIIFLDRELHVKRFTPRIQKIFNLLPSDLGRPISDITHQLAYESFLEDAKRVLETLTIIEKEVRVGDDACYLARLSPYRTADDRIAGVVATFIDITRRKTAEDQAQKLSKEIAKQLHKFNTVMTAVPDFIYHFDLEGRFTYANQALLDLWQKTLEQAVGKNFYELDYPPELAAKLQGQIQEVIATRDSLKDETPYTSAIGERQYEYIFFPLLAEDGSVEAVAGTTRDITERKGTEQALSESEERFRQFAENSADVFWILDAKTLQLEYVNPVYEKMFGQSRKVLMRDRVRRLDLVHVDDREEAASGLPRALAGETFVRNYRIIRPSDGEIRWIRDTGFPIRDEAGEVVRVAGVAQDITEEKERIEKLRENEERFRLVVEGAPEYAMFLMDTSNHIIYWSTGAERVFGWSSDEALGQSGEMIFTPEDRAREQEEKEMAIARKKGSAPDRRYHLRKDGSRIWVDGVMHRLDDENGELRGYAKIARDATEQRKAQEELQRAHDELEERVRKRTSELQAMNDTLEAEMERRQSLEREILQVTERERARISQDLHDSLCQELTATAFFLKSSARAFVTQDPEAAEALQEAAETVNENAGRARDLARGLHPFELSGGLPSALRELSSRIQEKTPCLCQVPRTLKLEENMAVNLYRIAQEALTNATKHAKPTEIEIRLMRHGDAIVLCVYDNGKLKTGKIKPGMGIHMMQYRANAIGGTLEIKSESGKGTKVICRVPVKR